LSGYPCGCPQPWFSIHVRRTIAQSYKPILLAVLSASSMAVATAAQRARDIGDRRQVFLDQRFFAATRGVSLEVKTPVKRGIVLQADDPKRTFIGQYGSVLEHDG